MELKDALFLSEKVMNMVATGQDGAEKRCVVMCATSWAYLAIRW